jgi:flagellar basal body-associated protein FliL
MFERKKNKKKNNILISGLVFAVISVFAIVILIFVLI